MLRSLCARSRLEQALRSPKKGMLSDCIKMRFVSVLGLQPGQVHAGLPRLRAEPVRFYILPASLYRTAAGSAQGTRRHFVYLILRLKEKNNCFLLLGMGLTGVA
jgi:hypothetical protein